LHQASRVASGPERPKFLRRRRNIVGDHAEAMTQPGPPGVRGVAKIAKVLLRQRFQMRRVSERNIP
jgi:hypothetical protein